MKDIKTELKSPIVVSISQYISKILKCLGLVEVDGFEYSSADTTDGKFIL